MVTILKLVHTAVMILLPKCNLKNVLCCQFE